MQIALVDGVRSEAFPSGKGSCPVCGSPVIAKCGDRVIHHWAHDRATNCDPWWENETVWHREWKNKFPTDCREVAHFAANGEIHRADVKTSTGIILEVQHSRISDEERIARENFHKNLVWVIDGSVFKKNFQIYHMLPNPDSNLAQDLVWTKATKDMYGAQRGIFIRRSEPGNELPESEESGIMSGWLHGYDEIRDEIEDSYNGYH